MTSRSSLCVAVAMVAVIAVGCAPAHVRLASLPADNASLETRRDFYEKNRPIVVRTTDAHLNNGGAWQRSFVVLNDGTRVDYASDLLVHVAPTSATGLAAARAQEAEDRAALLFTGGGSLTGVGIALMAPMVGMSLLDPRFIPSEVGVAIAAAGLVGSVTALAGGGALLFAQGSAGLAAQERDAAFVQYGKSLRKRLALNVEDVGDGGPATPDAQGVIVVRSVPR